MEFIVLAFVLALVLALVSISVSKSSSGGDVAPGPHQRADYQYVKHVVRHESPTAHQPPPPLCHPLATWAPAPPPPRKKRKNSQPKKKAIQEAPGQSGNQEEEKEETKLDDEPSLPVRARRGCAKRFVARGRRGQCRRQQQCVVL